MLHENLKTKGISETTDTGWNGLYQAAAVGVAITVILTLLDIALSFAGGDVEVGGMSAAGWFDYLQNSPFLGLRNLGLFNVINLTLTIPLYLALYRLHHKALPAHATLALILFVFGAAVYVATNRALAMLSLSNQYAAVSTEAQKSLLAAAGTVVLAQAEDFTPGTFPGFFLNTAGSLWMMAVMLIGGVFRKPIALLGLAGSSFLLIFTITVTFSPSMLNPAMILAMLGGVSMIAWNIIMVFRMFRLGRTSSYQNASPAAVHSAQSAGQ